MREKAIPNEENDHRKDGHYSFPLETLALIERIRIVIQYLFHANFYADAQSLIEELFKLVLFSLHPNTYITLLFSLHPNTYIILLFSLHPNTYIILLFSLHPNTYITLCRS